MKSGIYILKSRVSQKVYVGLSKDVYYRRKKHFELLKRGSHFNCHLQSHFNKYGLGDLSFEVLEHCPIEILETREIYWIDKLNALTSGFNQTEGGHLKDYLATLYSFENIKTGEILDNISAKNLCEAKGLDWSTVYKVINGKLRHTGFWKIKGKYLPKRKKSSFAGYVKTITLKNLKTGEVLSFESQQKASHALGIPQGSISHLFRGKRQTCMGFISLK